METTDTQTPAGRFVPTDQPDGLADTGTLAARLNAERQRVALPWPRFAALLGMNLSSVYKIASQVTTQSHMTTRARLSARLDELALLTPEQARTEAATLPVPAWATRGGRKKKTK